MLSFLAEVALRRRRAVLVVVLGVVALSVVVGGGVRDELSVGGFVDPDTESARTDALLEEHFDAGPANHVFVVTMRDEWVYSDANVGPGRALTAEIADEPGVTDVVSFWTLPIPPPSRSPLRSQDGTQALVALRLTGSEDDQRATAARLERFVGSTEHFDIEATGTVEVSRQAAEIAEGDLTRAELLAAPLTLLALLVVFRGWRAGLLPLVVAGVAVLVTFATLSVAAAFTSVSVFAVNLTTALGLGLAIDYSLLVVARYREELGRGHPADLALRRTLQTAGRTVTVSAATVAASLVALLVFPFVYLRSFAYAGVAVVTIAAASALITLPSLLAWLGPRIGAAVPPADDERSGDGFWGRQARRVLRRPAVWALCSVVVLAALAVPFAGIDPGRTDDRALPEDAGARHATTDLREHFTFSELNSYAVLVPGADPSDADAQFTYTKTVLALPDVVRVDSTLGFIRAESAVPPISYNERFGSEFGTWFSVASFRDPDDPEAEDLVGRLRTTTGPYAEVLVAGPTPTVSDTVASVTSRLPLALGIIAVVTFAVLFFLTGSVVVPLKAVVLNLASLTATFGALVWVFQDGHLADLLGFTPTGRLDVFTPILMFCIAFGLSMDYEVFVLARIKEEYDLRGDNDDAVVAGLAHTGGLVTAAAVILAIVFAAIATSGVSVVKMFGVGLGLAVLIDAFVVRATLTPALMGLAGRANWWAPAALRRFHLRWGVWENEPIDIPGTRRVG